MQYLLRFYLASLVVCFHMLPDVFPASGRMAVFGFYTISGYVITMALQQTYYTLPDGRWRFVKNRFYRLYPSFIAASLLGLMLAVATPQAASAINGSIKLPDFAEASLWEMQCFVSNFVLFGIHTPFHYEQPFYSRCEIRYAPETWSTNIELYFYAFMLLVGSRSRASISFWLAASLLGVLVIILTVIAGRLGWVELMEITPYSMWYYSVLGISLPFSLGAAVFFYRERLNQFLSLGRTFRIAMTLLVVALPLIPWPYLSPLIESGRPIYHWGYALVVAACLACYSDTVRSKSIRFLGDLSYPLFLIHWQCAVIVSLLFGLQSNTPELLITAFLLACLLSTLVVMLIDEPLKSIRAKNRGRSLDATLEGKPTQRVDHVAVGSAPAPPSFQSTRNTSSE
ncbi:MAG: acyltransferase [Pseudomonadota bacterium]